MSVLNAAEVLREIVRRGHTLRLDGDTLVVRPPMGKAMCERVLARKPDLVALLREFGPPDHVFVVLNSADDESIIDRGVCIGCGVPWVMHGMPPASQWLRVDDPDIVVLHAQGIVAAVVAENVTAASS